MQCIEGIQPNSSSLCCQPGVVECCWKLRNVLRNLDEAGGSTNLRFAGIQRERYSSTLSTLLCACTMMSWDLTGIQY